MTTPSKRGPGRPRGEPSPEHQIVISMYGREPNAAIAAALGITAQRLSTMVQALRRLGLIGADVRAAPDTRRPLVQVSVRLPQEEIDRAAQLGDDLSSRIRRGLELVRQRES